MVDSHAIPLYSSAHYIYSPTDTHNYNTIAIPNPLLQVYSYPTWSIFSCFDNFSFISTTWSEFSCFDDFSFSFYIRAFLLLLLSRSFHRITLFHPIELPIWSELGFVYFLFFLVLTFSNQRMISYISS